jgi:hypothetical protein
MMETMIGGVVVFDYDRDGDPDLFFPDGAPLPGYQGDPPRSRLLRNDGGRFSDVTARAGLVVEVYAAGGVAGDVEGDGDQDLYVTAFGANRLYRNRGDGTFAEATAEAGIGDPRFSASAAFADVDRDGDLDLYVANYVDFAFDNHKFCGDRQRGIRTYCHPEVYNGLADRFYRNEGYGRFVDATAEAGFGTARGAGLGVVIGDLTNDGWPDLYVANDLSPNLVFINQGDGTFTDESLLSGASYGEQGRVEAGMGVDMADVDGNGFADIVVTNFALETNAIYLNQGEGLFLDARHAAGLGERSLLKLAFGVTFADFDHDGDQDLLVANGHISDNAMKLGLPTTYRQPNQVFENLGAARFREVDAGLDVVRASRGLAVGDLDGDGDLDAVIVNSNDLTEIYENISPSPTSGWVMVDLAGRSSNSFGVGARLSLRTGAQTQSREVRTASSYLSQCELTTHFGTGEKARLSELTVAWPSGRLQRFRNLSSHRRYQIYE